MPDEVPGGDERPRRASESPARELGDAAPLGTFALLVALVLALVLALAFATPQVGSGVGVTLSAASVL